MDSSDALGEHRVFVGGVSWKVNDAMLQDFFESNYGNVIECKLIMDKQTGKSKGYGFVTFANPETAAAVKRLGSVSFMGKNMNVGDAYRKDPPAGNRGGMGGGGGGGGRMYQQGPPSMHPHHQAGVIGRPGGLLDRPTGGGGPAGHLPSPPSSQNAYAAPTQAQSVGNMYHHPHQQQPIATGYYQDPYSGGYYGGGQWAQPSPVASAQSVYGGYQTAAQQPAPYGAYTSYQQPQPQVQPQQVGGYQAAQQNAYAGYPQQQQGVFAETSAVGGWSQQQMPQFIQQPQQQLLPQMQQFAQQPAYGTYGMSALQ